MISGLIAIGIFLAAQLVGAVWWASSMHTKMGFMLAFAKDVKTMEGIFIEAKGNFATKEEVIRVSTNLEKTFSAMWKRIDELKTVKNGG